MSRNISESGKVLTFFIAPTATFGSLHLIKGRKSLKSHSNLEIYKVSAIFSLEKFFVDFQSGVILLSEAVGYVINRGTGEILEEFYEGDKVRVVRKAQVEYHRKNAKEIEKDKVYNFGQDKKFSMLSEYAAKQLADEKLTATEYRVLLLMISHTHYKSGLIAYGNNLPMTKNWISKKLNISLRTTESSVKTLIDRGIIAQNTTNHRTKYFFNPYIQYKGRWINRTLYEMFKNTRWAPK